jgi:hypothetical protein
VPLTLPRFYLCVNRSREPGVPIPSVEQEKQGAQGEQIIGSQVFPSCGLLSWGHFDRINWR